VLVRALAAIRDELAVALPAHDFCSYSAAEGPDTAAARCLALASCAGTLLNELYWELPDSDRVHSDSWLGTMVADIVYPAWRRSRDALRSCGASSMRSDLNFKSFVAAYLDLMSVPFHHWLEKWRDDRWTSGYAISEETWNVVKREFRPAGVTARKSESTWRKYDNVLLEGSFAAFVGLFDAGTLRLMAAIDLLRPRQAPPTRLAEEALET